MGRSLYSWYRLLRPVAPVILVLALVKPATRLYLDGLRNMNDYANTHSERLYSPPRLEEAVASERKKLNISPDVHIDIIYDAIASTSHSVMVGRKGFYDIVLSSDQHTRSTIRHELYHIAKGHCDDERKGFFGAMKYFFYEEPAAAMYSLRE